MNRVDLSSSPRAVGDAIASLLDAPFRLATGLAGALLKSGSCGCEIPPPCWQPRPAGRCVLTIPPGASATIRVHVSNCDWARRVIGITALGKLAGWMKFQPTTLLLDPQEHATFLVTIQVPAGVKPGEALSSPLLVRGCLDHFVRVEVRVAECAGPISCCDVHIQDCQDHIHHWYDHFYCPRPCHNPPIRDTKDG